MNEEILNIRFVNFLKR